MIRGLGPSPGFRRVSGQAVAGPEKPQAVDECGEAINEVTQPRNSPWGCRQSSGRHQHVATNRPSTMAAMPGGHSTSHANQSQYICRRGAGQAPDRGSAGRPRGSPKAWKTRIDPRREICGAGARSGTPRREPGDGRLKACLRTQAVLRPASLGSRSGIFTHAKRACGPHPPRSGRGGRRSCGGPRSGAAVVAGRARDNDCSGPPFLGRCSPRPRGRPRSAARPAR